MTTMAQHFDTLGAAEELEAAGLPAPAAKAISLVVDRSRENGNLASEIAALRTEFKEKIARVETDIAVLKSQMKFLFWAFGLIFVAVLANFAVSVNILLSLGGAQP